GNAALVEIRIFEEKVRDRAINSNEATQAVIDNCLTNLSDYAVACLPDFKHFNLRFDQFTYRPIYNDQFSFEHLSFEQFSLSQKKQ
ncbi:unnamed protein product, partial [Rotaria sp. Silwood2]